MKTRTLGLAAAALFSIGVAGSAHAAPIGIGPRLFVDLSDNTDFAIGVEGRFGVVQIAPSVRLDVRPFFDYYFIDNDFGDITLFDLGGDAIFAFNVGNPVVEPYAFAGLDIAHASGDGGSDTEVGLNLGGGAKFLTNGRIQPYAELRVTIGDFDPFLLGGGVIFIL